MGAFATMSLRASVLGFNSGMKHLEYPDIEIELGSVSGADNGFVVNPYQTVNPEQNQAIIMGTSVLYILREVKTFTVFAVALAVFGLISYVIIAYIFLNKIANPIIKADEFPKDVSEKEHDDDDNNNNKEPIDCIEDRTYSAALLSRSIDEMLSDIDKIMEKSRVKQGVLL
jgi:hypothetical protein